MERQREREEKAKRVMERAASKESDRRKKEANKGDKTLLRQLQDAQDEVARDKKRARDAEEEEEEAVKTNLASGGEDSSHRSQLSYACVFSPFTRYVFLLW